MQIARITVRRQIEKCTASGLTFSPATTELVYDSMIGSTMIEKRFLMGSEVEDYLSVVSSFSANRGEATGKERGEPILCEPRESPSKTYQSLCNTSPEIVRIKKAKCSDRTLLDKGYRIGNGAVTLEMIGEVNFATFHRV
jgi:hypothetical protein